MKILVLYRPNSEDARRTEEFIHDFERTYSKRIEVVNVDTRNGMAMVSLYDIMRHPAVLALRDDGQVIKIWQDDLPLMSELSYYAQGALGLVA